MTQSTRHLRTRSLFPVLLVGLSLFLIVAPPASRGGSEAQGGQGAARGWKLNLDRPGDKPSPNFRIVTDIGGMKGPPLDASQWGFEYRKAVTFGEHLIGLFPRFYNGQMENGGVPQRVDMAAHLDKVRRDVEAKLPDPNWDGFAMLDFESWAPWWTGTQKAYEDESRKLVRAERPDISDRELERRAKAAFEAAGRTFFERTIKTCQELRPRAKWGFYCYPQQYHRGTEQTLKWLWDSVDVMYPGFYFSWYGLADGQPPKEGQQPISSTIDEMRAHFAFARQLADAGPKKKLVAALLSPRYFDANKTYAWTVLNDDDIEVTLRLPMLCGVDAELYWDYIRNEGDSVQLRRFFEDKFGPAGQKVIAEARERANQQGGQSR
ncbi:MAG TPA: hypothetical protein VG797_03040 [Phycisphaerales bacterium]|nr:hypothetical protein [Phycisphaerales bacterium]